MASLPSVREPVSSEYRLKVRLELYAVPALNRSAPMVLQGRHLSRVWR
jgi:hypothetical protein